MAAAGYSKSRVEESYAALFTAEWDSYSSISDATNTIKNHEAFVLQFDVATAINNNEKCKLIHQSERYTVLWKIIGYPSNREGIIRALIYIFNNFDTTKIYPSMSKEDFIDCILRESNYMFGKTEKYYKDFIIEPLCNYLSLFMISIVNSEFKLNK